MSMVFDPEKYRATGKHFAHYELPPSPENWETWFAEAVCDNGYFLAAMFCCIGGGVVMNSLCVVDPTGKTVVDSHQFFEAGEYSLSTETLDIKMGHNYYRGNFPVGGIPTSEVYVLDDQNNGAELFYESIVQPTISELPEGVGIGRMSIPQTPSFVGWFFQPHNKITGKLVIRGEEIPITATGWTDHQMGNTDFFNAVEYSIWACLPLGEHTLNIFESQLTEKMGSRPIKWLWDWKGEKLYEYCRDCSYYIELSGFEEDDVIPRKLLFVFEHSRIRGTISCDFIIPIERIPRGYANRQVMNGRAAYKCHVNLEIDNEKIDITVIRPIDVACTVPKTVESVEENEGSEELQSGGFSIDSNLGDVVKNPAGLELLEKFVPGISTDPNAKMGHGMPIKVIFGMPQLGVPKEKLAELDKELRTIE